MCVYTYGKVRPITDHAGPEGSTPSLTWALDGVGGQRHAPTALLQGKTRYPSYRGLGGARTGLDGCGKSLQPPGFVPRAVQRLASRYTD